MSKLIHVSYPPDLIPASSAERMKRLLKWEQLKTKSLQQEVNRLEQKHDNLKKTLQKLER